VALAVHPEPVTAVGAARFQPSPKNITVTTRGITITSDITARSTTKALRFSLLKPGRVAPAILPHR
jgi:hypothetical protein